eukprot:2545119-Pyramimonas_sp.AAC.1
MALALIGRSQDTASLVGEWEMLSDLDEGDMKWDMVEVDIRVHNSAGLFLEAKSKGKGKRGSLSKTTNRPTMMRKVCGMMCFFSRQDAHAEPGENGRVGVLVVRTGRRRAAGFAVVGRHDHL